MSESKYTIGNIDISTVKSKRPIRKGTLYNLVTGFMSLMKGMKITAYYFFHTKEVVTEQYPENRETLKISERFRAELKLKKDDRGFLNCTGCNICAQNCPNGSIEVIAMKGETNKKEIDRYIWHMDSCTFCNICVQVCPYDAIEMKPNFESSALDRRLYIYQLNKYAGPTKKNLDKLEDPADMQRLVNLIKREPYKGPIPLGMQQGEEHNFNHPEPVKKIVVKKETAKDVVKKDV
ncbi:MAG: 4Fe-4S binding protein [Bdellovibrionaceae bacterium]|nr:4Fe-4S binding protein [Pseudobdellovibrionaceae bacterium]